MSELVEKLQEQIYEQKKANGRPDFQTYKKELRKAADLNDLEQLYRGFIAKYLLSPKQADFARILKDQRRREVIYGVKSRYF